MGLPVDVCSACGRETHPDEERLCAFCRMRERGDARLLSHDRKGWLGRVETITRQRRDPGAFVLSWKERREFRVACGCGCGMVEVPDLVTVRP